MSCSSPRTNTRPNRLGSTAVPADFVQRCMRASRSRSIVLLLDCCYGGAFSQGVAVRAAGDVNVLDSFPGGRLGGGRGRAVITASSAMEYAFEGDQLADDRARAPSVFTAALVEGLATGDADRDEDGWVSLNELYDYVFDRVRDAQPPPDAEPGRRDAGRAVPGPQPAAPHPPAADPGRPAGGDHRRQHVHPPRRGHASCGPGWSATTCRSPPAPTRRWPRSPRSDIAYVADAAAQAMRDVAIRVDPPELNLGGGDAVLRLLGPPLARACTHRASDDWIRVAETADGLAVSAEPAAGPAPGQPDPDRPDGRGRRARSGRGASAGPGCPARARGTACRGGRRTSGGGAGSANTGGDATSRGAGAPADRAPAVAAGRRAGRVRGRPHRRQLAWWPVRGSGLGGRANRLARLPPAVGPVHRRLDHGLGRRSGCGRYRPARSARPERGGGQRAVSHRGRRDLPVERGGRHRRFGVEGDDRAGRRRRRRPRSPSCGRPAVPRGAC